MNTKINCKVFKTFPVLESDRLIFREFVRSDSEDLFFIRSNDQIMEFMDTDKHLSVLESEFLITQIEESFRNQTGINWAIVEKSTNRLIGYFGFWRIMKDHCRAEIGFALKSEFWGEGFMSESLKRLLDFGFKDFRIHSIEANINPANENSKLLLEKNGFKQEAYFRENYFFNGKFIDSIIYSLLEPDLK
jgi:ribosomal-protein-alanine N-acetyltransferase